MQNLNCEYFCNYWFRDCTGLIEISYMDHFRERAYPQWFKLANIPCARMLNEKSRNVYYGLATRKGRRGTEEHVLELPGLWGDTDPKDFLGGQEHKEFEELAAKGAGKGLWDGNPQRLTDEEFRRMIELSEKARALMLKQLSQCPLPPTILISSGKVFSHYGNVQNRWS